MRPLVPPRSARETFRVALGLGLTSFGGPVAHIGYFRREYVEERRWLDEHAFADLVALCQSLPGPASSQLGIAIGTRRAGLTGGLAAWLGFTLPSAVIMTALAIVAAGADIADAPWVHGLRIAAVAVVAQAVFTMARTLAPDLRRALLAGVAALVALAWPMAFTQVAIIVGGAIVGSVALEPSPRSALDVEPRTVTRRAALVGLAIFIGLLVALPVARQVSGYPAVAQADAYYRAGALVFGGGHLVLPLLDATVVASGWVTQGAFLAGYGAAQAVPGPLFTFASYLGGASSVPPGGVAGAVLATVAIFLPSCLLVWAALGFWDELRGSVRIRRALAGTNAAVVGILAAALYTPVWTGAISAPSDAAIAGLALVGLMGLRLPPIMVVVLTALATQVVATIR